MHHAKWIYGMGFEGSKIDDPHSTDLKHFANV